MGEIFGHTLLFFPCVPLRTEVKQEQAAEAAKIEPPEAQSAEEREAKIRKHLEAIEALLRER